LDELKKNQEYDCTITGVTSEGMGVGRIGGRAVFIRDALPEEQCRVQLLRVSSNGVYGKVLHRENESPHRIVPDCPYFGKCGGCDWRHSDYDGELAWKLQRVNDAFQRIGGLSLRAREILPAPNQDRYRAKAIFAVGQDPDGHAVTGFYRARSHDIIPVTDCRLQTEEANEAARVLREWMDEQHIPAYRETVKKGLIRHLFVRNGMVCIVAAGKPVRTDALLRRLQAALPGLRSLIWNENRNDGNAVLSGSFRTLWGTDTVDVALSGLHFRLSPRSFFQINPSQAERLYALAIEKAALTGLEHVIDLYCGTGSIGLLAAPKAKSVTGVEVIAAAVEDARDTAKRNGIENARFLCADAAEAAAALAAEGQKPDVLFVDPPRKGLEESVIASIAAMAPHRVIYVSCDPGTLARDLRRFTDTGYEAKYAAAVDMFPRTRHVETVVLLSKLGEAKHHITVELKTDELDITPAEAKASYEEIRDYVKQKYNLTVSHLNIAQVKRKNGIIERENYNLPKNADSKQPKCTPEKEMAITEALKHFKMIKTN